MSTLTRNPYNKYFNYVSSYFTVNFVIYSNWRALKLLHAMWEWHFNNKNTSFLRNWGIPNCSITIMNVYFIYVVLLCWGLFVCMVIILDDRKSLVFQTKLFFSTRMMVKQIISTCSNQRLKGCTLLVPRYNTIYYVFSRVRILPPPLMRICTVVRSFSIINVVSSTLTHGKVYSIQHYVV